MDNIMTYYRRDIIMKRIYLVLIGLLLALNIYPQDVRTTGTRVADLLSRMPVYNRAELERQMGEMVTMGTEGRLMICKMLIPPGTGDDTRARFALESYSRFLSETGNLNCQINPVNPVYFID